ncbi:MAG: tRNA guanosine(34) transglycosylase Tgt [Actinobacteria bacterium]|nr:MAG: tRNA guanosine(34) transglycosylase Tgt [Actinomycetota bacterium]
MGYFKVKFKDKESRARIGELKLSHGSVETPVFMPVGTKAAVRTLSPDELNEINVQIILSNAYHLNHKPGIEIIEKHGSLHKFMAWQKPILTDSGGFQAISLAKHVKIFDEGIEFRYPEDGQKAFFTPEKVIDIQKRLKSDVVMVLDEPTPYPFDKEQAKQALIRTSKWARISRNQKLKAGQKMFGIIQGAAYKDFRKKSAQDLTEIGFDCYAVGRLSVPEPKEILFEVLDYSTDFLPDDKPRYLMGLGDPLSLIKSIQMGIDMFDSVLPTRLARNGTVFSSEGKMNLKNAIYKLDKNPLDKKCTCPTCGKYTRSYLRHIYTSGEILAHRLLSWHNLHYLTSLLDEAKKLLKEGKVNNLEKELEQIYAKSTSD